MASRRTGRRGPVQTVAALVGAIGRAALNGPDAEAVLLGGAA